MAVQPLLLLAVTRMIGGVCIAGMSTQPDARTGLRWIRPVRAGGQVLLGDITTAQGEFLQPFDVVALNLLEPRPDTPHVEDWIADFVRPRPALLRRLEGERRAEFLRQHLDRAHEMVLDGCQRSLCLVQPDACQGSFQLDGHTRQLDARLSFRLGNREYPATHARNRLPVTDLRWRALGRSWLPACGGRCTWTSSSLEARLGLREIYLSVGLSRPFEGRCWPMVVGVHTVPDHLACVDYAEL